MYGLVEVKAAFACVWSVGGREGKASESAGEETRMRYLCSLAKEFGRGECYESPSVYLTLPQQTEHSP